MRTSTSDLSLTPCSVSICAVYLPKFEPVLGTIGTLHFAVDLVMKFACSVVCSAGCWNETYSNSCVSLAVRSPFQP